MDLPDVLKLIKDISEFWDASLRASAMDVIRDPDDTKKMEYAQRLLVKAEERKTTCEMIAGVVKQNWPKGEE